jgi:mitofilin
VTEAAGRVVSDVQDISSDAAKKAKDAEKEAKAKFLEARDQARKQVARVTPAGGSKEVAQDAKEVAKDAKAETKSAVESLKEKKDSLVQKASNAAEDAEKKVTQRAKDAQKQVESRLDHSKVGSSAAPSSSAPAKPYDRPLPISHEAPQGYVAAQSGDRKLKAEKNDTVRLRADPQAPKLPQLRPALSSLTGSEPMIGQLAGTIDDLAAFLKDTPSSGTNAKYVLDEAKEELQRLSKRLDEIRKTEQSRAEKTLSSQAQKYEKELKQKADEQSKKFSQLDAEGKKKVTEEREKAKTEYETRLRTELDTQKEIINERLKEEVVAQGVEMQRRWMTEIKKRVEEERGGRLARLDELASELAEVQEVTYNNSAALEEGSSAHRTAAAVRALYKAATSEGDDEDQAGRKRAFRKELTLLRSSPLAQQSEIVQKALEVLDVGGTPDQGVESLGSLTSWYISKVKPRLQSVALLPEQAGLLSHITSAVLSPLLFTKSGNPQGADVPSILARAEYALLQKGDLEAATREINSLKGWGKVLAEDWLRESRRRLEVEQGVKIVQAEAAYNSLLNA